MDSAADTDLAVGSFPVTIPHSNLQRVRNVVLAVDLARHAANGWNDAALPDDYENIAKLLHMQPSDVMTIVGASKQAEVAHNHL